MAESDKPSGRPPLDEDGAPTLEVIGGEAGVEADASSTADDELDVDHEPTTQGLGFDAVGFLAGVEEKRKSVRRQPATNQGLGFDPVAHMLGLAPKSAAPAVQSDAERGRRISSHAPEQPRQTLPTRSASQRPDRPALRRLSTQDFDVDLGVALVEAEAALAATPDDEEAQRLVTSLRQQLERAYAERLAPMERVVVRAKTAASDGLDHDARFVVSFVDGARTIAQIVEKTAMTPLDAMRVLDELARNGVVDFRS